MALKQCPLKLGVAASSTVLLYFWLAVSGNFGATDGAVCETVACHRLATFLKRQIEPSADPCQNFYNHACGKYARDHKCRVVAFMKNDHKVTDTFAAQIAVKQSQETAEPTDATEIAQQIIKNATRDGFDAADDKWLKIVFEDLEEVIDGEEENPYFCKVAEPGKCDWTGQSNSKKFQKIHDVKAAYLEAGVRLMAGPWIAGSPPDGSECFRKFLRLAGGWDPQLPNAVRYAKRYFDACLRWDRDGQDAQDQIVAYIKDFAIWPLFNQDDWQQVDISFIDVVGRLIGTLAVSSVVHLEIAPDKFESTRTGLYLKPPKFGFDPLALHNETIFPGFKDQYRRLIVRAFKTLVVNAGITVKGGQAGLKKIAQDIVNFEAELASQVIPEAQIQENSIEELQKFYNPYSLKEMNKVYNNTMLWSKFFRAAFRNEPEGIGWLKNKNNKIIVTQEPFFKYLPVAYAKTPKDTIANYLLWKLVQTLGPAMGEDYDNVFATDQSTRKSTKSIKRDTPPEKQKRLDCFTEVEEIFPDAVTRVYVEKRYPAAKEEAADSLAKELVASARKTFEANTWLTPVAKERVLAKLDNIFLGIGYPKFVKDNAKLDVRYDKWKVVPSNTTYFENTVKFSKWNYKELLVPPDRTEFLDPPTLTGNAHYAPELNSLTVPAGTFEYPFFDVGFPQAYRYGLVGVVTGHEIFHGFDNNGVLYDAVGNNSESVIRGGSWLLEGSNDTFANLTQCLVDDFDKFCYNDLPSWNSLLQQLPKEPTEPGGPGGPNARALLEELKPDATQSETNQTVCVNGTFTLGENLADFNGIHAAWNAFLANQKEAKNSETDLRLPGLENYDNNQLFFLAWSVFWCEGYNPYGLLYQLHIDEHSPGDARVNQAVKHLPAFGETFKCKKGRRATPCTRRRSARFTSSIFLITRNDHWT